MPLVSHGRYISSWGQQLSTDFQKAKFDMEATALTVSPLITNPARVSLTVDNCPMIIELRLATNSCQFSYLHYDSVSLLRDLFSAAGLPRPTQRRSALQSKEWAELGTQSAAFGSGGACALSSHIVERSHERRQKPHSLVQTRTTFSKIRSSGYTPSCEPVASTLQR